MSKWGGRKKRELKVLWLHSVHISHGLLHFAVTECMLLRNRSRPPKIVTYIMVTQLLVLVGFLCHVFIYQSQSAT